MPGKKHHPAKWLRNYAYAWLTLLFFVTTLLAHWFFGWRAYVNEQTEFHHRIEFSEYAVEAARDTFENWQSEFLQLIWQVAGLAYLLYVGSPQSKDGDERLEEKLDVILRVLEPKRAENILRELEARFPKS